MASGRRIVALGLLIAAGVGFYVLWRPGPPAPVVGTVRATEIRVAPEVGGNLAAIKVQKGLIAIADATTKAGHPREAVKVYDFILSDDNLTNFAPDLISGGY